MLKFKFQINYEAVCRRLAIFCLAALVFAAAGCRTESGDTAQVTAAPRQITDDLGRTVLLPERIERAVSLAPNLTETVFAVGAGERLVGVTTFCNYPAEAQRIRKIGDTVNPNLEAIISLRPQIVLVSTASQIESFTHVLAQQNIAVFVTNPQDTEGVYRSIGQIGEIFGLGERATETIGALKKRVADVETRVGSVRRVKVFVQISDEPLFTVGGASFLTDLIRRAGGESLTAGVAEAYPKFSKETALAVQSEAIILSDSDDNRRPNRVFADSPAVKNNRIYRIDADVMSRPSPRIVEALEQIARALHPEQFK